MKRLFMIVAVGAFLGGVISNLFAPRVIGWYFDPPVDIGVTCRPAVEWGVTHFQYMQFGGSVAGAIIGLVLVQFFSKKKHPGQRLS